MRGNHRGGRHIRNFRDQRRTCVIVATGPSAGTAQLELVAGWPCIAVNDAYRLTPDADALYAADYAWWKFHIKAIRESFTGQLWSCSSEAGRDFGCRTVGIARRGGLSHRADEIRQGGRVGNSGAQAINLAFLWGARRLVLVGFDFAGSHFFGDHPRELAKTSAFDRMREGMGELARDLYDNRVEVINCSARSALTFWPKRTLAEALTG